MNSFFLLANSIDPDVRSHSIALYQGHHCLQKYLYSGSVNKIRFSARTVLRDTTINFTIYTQKNN